MIRPARASRPAPAFVPATEKQLSFLVSLAVERGWTFNAQDNSLTNPEGTVGKLAELDKRAASAVIDGLLKTPKVPNAKYQATRADEVTEDGMYRKDGVIYKVQYAANGSGRLYAKQLVVEEDAVRNEDGKIIEAAVVYFEYVSGAIKQLTPAHKMTRDEAAAFGALYGTCCVCGRTLTDEKSIEAGIGPVCGSRF